MIFLKYISDVFEEQHAHLLKEAADPKSEYYVKETKARYEVAEDRGEYTTDGRERKAQRVLRDAEWDIEDWVLVATEEAADYVSKDSRSRPLC